MNTYQQDLAFGLSKEDEFHHVLDQHFQDDLIRVSNRYSRYDFKGTKYVYELKSRNCSVGKYPTTMIGADKIMPNSVFIFAFTDGLYFIYYDPIVFSKFEVKEFRRYRTGKEDVQKDYVYIPTEYLTKLQ